MRERVIGATNRHEILRKNVVRKNSNARAEHIECAKKTMPPIETHLYQLFHIQTGRGGFSVNTPAAQVNAGAGERAMQLQIQKGGGREDHNSSARSSSVVITDGSSKRGQQKNERYEQTDSF